MSQPHDWEKRFARGLASGQSRSPAADPGPSRLSNRPTDNGPPKRTSTNTAAPGGSANQQSGSSQTSDASSTSSSGGPNASGMANKFAPWGQKRIFDDANDPGKEQRYIDPTFFMFGFNFDESCPLYTDEEIKNDNRMRERSLRKKQEKTAPYWQHVARHQHSCPTASWTDIEELKTGKPVPFHPTKAPFRKPDDMTAAQCAAFPLPDDSDEDFPELSIQDFILTDSSGPEDSESEEEDPKNYPLLRRILGPPPSEWRPETWPVPIRNIFFHIINLRGFFDGPPEWGFILVIVFAIFWGATLFTFLGWVSSRAAELRKLGARAFDEL
ncbi:hypothetical protein H072_2343 [Dactylellina haptotyla CBS 200.50]|uniref:Uncharacterized protein n=1 Tax=Dactylellina haptotyla (strain CBS 200.50) TaxID=1284197 RepID=S8ARK1_DACHA|nr:hypothetical protein H072_2343 [Dactylellina haptotyla CBS 200.50]